MEIVDLLEYSERAQLREWFERNAASQKCCWVAMYRSKTKPEGLCLPYLDVVEEALCFGWIDSTLKRLPDDRGYRRSGEYTKTPSARSDLLSFPR